MYKWLMDIAPPRNFSEVINNAYEPSYTVVLKKDLFVNISDGMVALFAPIIAYWVYATFFHIIDVYELAEKYRIHPSEEELARNKVTLPDVIRDVILQHIMQTIVGLCMLRYDDKPTTGHELHSMWVLRNNYVPSIVPDYLIWYGYMYGFSFLKILVGFCIIDTWQYWLHKYMHMNKYLYRRFHSRHHRLYVPYSYGALYNDPVEGLLLDTFGAGIAMLVMRLTPREAIWMFTFATMKTVDDHCGYRLPFDIFQLIFSNNSIYHDIHHQSWGIKHNFAQPFFTFWDRLFGTGYEFVDQYKAHQTQITLKKYKEFLALRKAPKLHKETKKDI